MEKNIEGQMSNKIQLFEQQKVRTVWDKDTEKWWFSVVDVIAVLTESERPRKYWDDLKRKLKEEGSELFNDISNQDGFQMSEKIGHLKMLSPDGKMRLTDVADIEQILRIIQSVPSKRAEPFKQWLAKVGSERIDEAVDPELSIDRAIHNYRRLGYSESWINQRIKSIEIRKALTDEWDRAGVKQEQEYALLTDLMTKTWSGMTTKEYKQHKNLKKENLRDNMTNLELVINMLSEASTTELSANNNPRNLSESAKIARQGANIAKNARKEIESKGGKVISSQNAKQLGKRKPLLN